MYMANMFSSFLLPKAVLQLAWRPVARDGVFEIAVAGEDSSLRINAFSRKYLEGAYWS